MNHDKAGADSDERYIKGIPIKQFIDEVKRQERARNRAEGNPEDYPIKIPGIGLHAIQDKQKEKEKKAAGGKAVNPKFQYQRQIADHFLRDERRLKSRESDIFNQLEDLLDDEKVRQTIEQLELAKKKSRMAI